MTRAIRIGLLGFGRAGRAVARVLLDDPTVRLCWVARRSDELAGRRVADVVGVGTHNFATIHSTSTTEFSDLLRDEPVDAVIDFSSACTLQHYAHLVIDRGAAFVTAVSHYSAVDQELLARLGRRGRVLWSPNISLGINCLMVVAAALRSALPDADVAIVEEHFRDKSGVSGTALRLASSLSVEHDAVTSLRFGGVVGTHTVVFGLPDQTLRLSHESVSREAFGTGAVFAVKHMLQRPAGLYTMEELIRPVLWPETGSAVRASA